MRNSAERRRLKWRTRCLTEITISRCSSPWKTRTLTKTLGVRSILTSGSRLPCAAIKASTLAGRRSGGRSRYRRIIALSASSRSDSLISSPPLRVVTWGSRAITLIYLCFDLCFTSNFDHILSFYFNSYQHLFYGPTAVRLRNHLSSALLEVVEKRTTEQTEMAHTWQLQQPG